MISQVTHKIYKFTMPLAVFLPRKTMPPRKYIVNKNNERNWNPFVCKAVKVAYCDVARLQLNGLVFNPRIRLDFTYYKPTARRSDRTNVLSQHEKFFADAMVECGCMEDDSDEYIAHSHYYGGQLDRKNPRVEIVVSELIEREF